MSNKSERWKRRAAVWSAAAILATLASAPRARADIILLNNGTLSTPENTFTTTLDLTSASTVVLQTLSFGEGGFDPLVGIFSGTGAAATVVTDASSNPYITSDLLTNYSSFMGCPPADTVNIAGAVCGDITMSLSLAAGTYTVLLADAGYLPNAIFDNGTLGEGFADFTGGVFQTCNSNGLGDSVCLGREDFYTLDTTISPVVATTPEPATLTLLGMGLAAMRLAHRRRALKVA